MFEDVVFHDCQGWDLKHDCSTPVLGEDENDICKECRFKRALLDSLPFSGMVTRPWRKKRDV